MGWFHYDDTAGPIMIEDRTLAHLKVVIVTKLRRNESFTMTWTHPTEDDGERSSIWLSPPMPLRFIFESPEPAELNPEWLVKLSETASITGEIRLVPEDTGPLTLPPIE